MKYVWVLVVMAGCACIFLGLQQLKDTENLGRYPCFPCVSGEPDLEVVVFSSADCPRCEAAIGNVQKFCRLTGVKYGGAFYDDAEESGEKLSELGLEKETDFLIAILKNGAVIYKSTGTETVEAFLSEKVKEASRL